MIFFFIPWIFVIMAVLAVLGIASEAMDINIMPYIAIPCLIMSIIGIVNAVRTEKNERKTHVILASIFFFVFLLTVSSNVTVGESLSWIWYHI